MDVGCRSNFEEGSATLGHTLAYGELCSVINTISLTCWCKCYTFPLQTKYLFHARSGLQYLLHQQTDTSLINSFPKPILLVNRFSGLCRHSFVLNSMPQDAFTSMLSSTSCAFGGTLDSMVIVHPLNRLPLLVPPAPRFRDLPDCLDLFFQRKERGEQGRILSDVFSQGRVQIGLLND